MPTPTAHGLSESELSEARDYALALINDARKSAGLNLVTLDDNPTAQSHAEDMRANCFLSHWGTDGLKPYMRYTLAGGEQFSGENVSGIGYCPTDPHRYTAGTIKAELDEAMNSLMNSPGHRRNILNPHHRKVGIGISYQRPNLWLAQLFVGDYVRYTTKPIIEDGTLTLAGILTNGATVQIDDDLGVQIYFDPPTKDLTRGQLIRTYCYSSGLPIASLRPPLGRGWFYNDDLFFTERSICPNPYDVDINASLPRSYQQAHELWRQAYLESQSINSPSYAGRWITANEWEVTDTSFKVLADISQLLKLIHNDGNGVYTIVLWGKIDGADVPVSEYSVFIPPLNDTQAHILAHVTPTLTPSPTPAPKHTPVPTVTVTPIPTPSPTPTQTPTSTPTPTASPTPTSIPEVDALELEDLTHELINAQRVMHGFEPLEHDEAIRLIARNHSEDMASRDYFSHVSPDGLDSIDRGDNAGYDCFKDRGSSFTFGLRENIHQGWLFDSYQKENGRGVNVDWLTVAEIAQIAVDGWMNSPGHRQNILDSSYDRAGMGVAITEDGKVFFTQNFC